MYGTQAFEPGMVIVLTSSGQEIAKKHIPTHPNITLIRYIPTLGPELDMCETRCICKLKQPTLIRHIPTLMSYVAECVRMV